MRSGLTALATILISVLLPTTPAGAQDATAARLLDEFMRSPLFWKQLDVGRELANVGDAQVVRALEPLLAHEDRHLRANAAFVLARLNDPRGLETLFAILTDRSSRPRGQAVVPFNAVVREEWLPFQIRADRYYAVHVLGALQDRRAVSVLIPFLEDPEIDYNVAWALGQIGDDRAIPPLIRALEHGDADVRASAIHALGALGAKQALPHLQKLLDDRAIPRAGPRRTVADDAKAAIAKLQKMP